MSRTYKDKPWKLRTRSNWGFNREDKPKLPKRVNTEWQWQNTPSWWTYMFMIRPRRTQENQQLKQLPYIEDLEDFDFVDVKRKNHIYYW